MTTLGKELIATIKHLEALRDQSEQPSAAVTAQLDLLYDQQIDLIDAAIDKNTQNYINATAAMRQAAKATREARSELATLEQSIDKVSAAIAKVTKLLDKIV